MNNKKAISKFWFIFFIGIFLILYFSFLIQIYNVRNGYETSILLSIGFTVLIVSLFYFFIFLISGEKRGMSISFKIFDESVFKLIILILFIISFFIPPISISETIVAWSYIGFMNYFRAVISLFGILYLPGSSIYNLLIKNNSLHEKFRIESIFLKLTIIPLLSLACIGFMVMFLDFLKFERILLNSILLIAIIILSFSDIIMQKRRKSNWKILRPTHLEFSKYTIFIFILALGVIVIAISYHLSSLYMLPGDRWRGMSYAFFVGKYDLNIDTCCGVYYRFWGYISYGLSALSGFPYININTMLFPLVYIMITSSYLLTRAILIDHSNKYSILSTIFIALFSGIFYIFSLENLEPENAFFLNGIIQFSYHNYSFYCLFAAIALFSISMRKYKIENKRNVYLSEKFKILILSVILLMQSYVTYLIPILIGFSFNFVYILYLDNKKENFKLFLKYFLVFVITFIIYDLISGFYFSWVPVEQFKSFTNLFLFSQIKSLNTKLLLSAILVYSILISIYFILFLFFKIYYRCYLTKLKKYYKLKPNHFYIIGLGIFFIFINLYIFIILADFFQIISLSENFFVYYIYLFFSAIGLIGIIGIISSYSSYKMDKKLFKVLTLWFLFIISLASILIMIRWIQYPFSSPLEIPETSFINLRYWWRRTWYYSVIPLSIFASIGILKLIKKVKGGAKFKKKKVLKRISIYGFISFLIFFGLTNNLIHSFYLTNYRYHADDDEAYILGWISENLPIESKILTDCLDNKMSDLAYCFQFRPYYVFSEISEQLDSQGYRYYYDWEGRIPHNGWWKINHNYNPNCIISYIENGDGVPEILNFSDNSQNGHCMIEIDFNSNRTSGYIEFLLKTSNHTKIFEIDLFSIESIKVISFRIDSNSFYCYNGSEYQKIMDIEDDIWYNSSIFFESTNNGYNNLTQFWWKFIVNGTEYGDYKFTNDLINIQKIIFSSNNFESDYNIYLDTVKFSWDLEFNIKPYVFYTPIMVKHFRLKQINYFIHNIKFEGILSNERYEYSEFISTQFTQKIYEYKNFEVYTSESSIYA